MHVTAKPYKGQSVLLGSVNNELRTAKVLPDGGSQQHSTGYNLCMLPQQVVIIKWFKSWHVKVGYCHTAKLAHWHPAISCSPNMNKHLFQPVCDPQADSTPIGQALVLHDPTKQATNLAQAQRTAHLARPEYLAQHAQPKYLAQAVGQCHTELS